MSKRNLFETIEDKEIIIERSINHIWKATKRKILSIAFDNLKRQATTTLNNYDIATTNLDAPPIFIRDASEEESAQEETKKLIKPLNGIQISELGTAEITISPHAREKTPEPISQSILPTQILEPDGLPTLPTHALTLESDSQETTPKPPRTLRKRKAKMQIEKKTFSKYSVPPTPTPTRKRKATIHIEKETSSESSALPTPTPTQTSTKSVGKRKVNTESMSSEVTKRKSFSLPLDINYITQPPSQNWNDVRLWMEEDIKKLQNILLMYKMKNLKSVLDLKVEFVIYSEGYVQYIIAWVEKNKTRGHKISTIFTQPEFIEERKKTPNPVATPMSRAFGRGERVSSRAYEILMRELPEERATSLSDEIIGARRAHKLILTVGWRCLTNFPDITPSFLRNITNEQMENLHIQISELKNEQFTEGYNSTEIHKAPIDPNINRALTGFDYRRYLCGLREQKSSSKK
ncbi:9819_t:CDS:2 [Acaulospora morrowiae]|uniref:9819_t:CDS:1 n=1 Tax=Acaulospora morrowiae TaxID=94023 RepID=A0A9N8WFR8_9GLOM|nr:9819_t:CDS:2 [Acaulospora morrowiae]